MLKKIVTVLILMSLLPLPVLASDSWTKEDTHRQMLSSVLLIIDWSQTHETTGKDSGFKESNPILGLNPSRERVNQYFAVVSIANLVISRMLPAREREWFQSIVIGVELLAVGNNYKIGMKANF